MSAEDRVLLFSLLLQLAVCAGVADVDGCANGFPDMNLIVTKAQETTTGSKLTSGLSLLNAFTCQGTLLGLVLGVDVRTETSNRNMFPEISLWRPEEQDELDEEYDIVQGSERTVHLTPANFSTSGVFEYAIVPPLDFQANDILGWNQPEDGQSVVRMYTIDGTEFMITRIIPDSVSSNSFDLDDAENSDDVLLLYPVLDAESAASCDSQQFLSEGTVRSKATMISDIKKRDKTQRIFPDMHFSCTGLLTKWIIGGEQRADKTPLPELQLWRKNGENSYNKTGVSLISTPPTMTSHTNVYEYILDSPLEFQEGDIFGLYKPKESDSVLNIFLQHHSGPFTYGQKKDASMSSTELIVDPTQLLNQNDYPMVSVEISITDLSSKIETISSTVISSATISSAVITSVTITSATSSVISIEESSSQVPSSKIQTISSAAITTNGKDASTSDLGSMVLSSKIEATSSPVISSATISSAVITSATATITSTTITSAVITSVTITSATSPVISIEESSSQVLSSKIQTISSAVVISNGKDASTSELVSMVLSSKIGTTSSPVIISATISNAVITSATSSTITSSTITNSVKVTSTLVMTSATYNEETTNTSPAPTVENVPNDQEDQSSTVPLVIAILVVITLLIFLLVLVVIGIVIMKRKRQKSYTPNSTSIQSSETEYEKGFFLTAVDRKDTVKIASLPKPLTKDTGFTNPVYEFDDRKNSVKIASLPKPLTKDTSFTNPVYELKEDEKPVHGFSFTGKQNEVENLMYMGNAEGTLPARTFEADSYAVLEYSALEYSDVHNPQIPVHVPTMAERRKVPVSVPQEAGLQCTSSKPECQNFFVEDDIYWNPGSNRGIIYEQLAQKRFREISKKHIQIIHDLGSGQFGLVSKGVWYSTTGPKDVAIKMLKDEAEEMEKIKFLQEAAIMGQFHHPHVITLHGVVTVGEPMMIVLELMEKGDLRQYLHSFRPTPGEMLPTSLENTLLNFCREIASGMEYLAKKSFVHRDLAARNVLVSAERHCKIADFGMSRDLMDDDYYKSSGGQIPIKWTAPEALLYKKYSTASDVWSFGVLMYEIWSLGHKPFEDRTNQEAYRSLCNGYRLPPPPGCPRTIYQLMIQCWHPETAIRPSFSSLASLLSQPDSELLVWLDEDQNCHPQASVLGAPLEAGDHLYSLMQKTYM